MSISGQEAPLADVERVEADVETIREVAGALDLDIETLQTALALRTLVELRELDTGAGGGARPRPAGAPVQTDIGSVKSFRFSAQAEAGDHILSEHFDIDARIAVLRTTVAIQPGGTNATFSVHLHRGNDDFLLDYLQGQTLTAGSVYALDLPLTEGISVNYEVDQDNILALLVAQEIDVAGP